MRGAGYGGYFANDKQNIDYLDELVNINEEMWSILSIMSQRKCVSDMYLNCEKNILKPLSRIQRIIWVVFLANNDSLT